MSRRLNKTVTSSVCFETVWVCRAVVFMYVELRQKAGGKIRVWGRATVVLMCTWSWHMSNLSFGSNIVFLNY